MDVQNECRRSIRFLNAFWLSFLHQKKLESYQTDKNVNTQLVLWELIYDFLSVYLTPKNRPN